MKRHLFWIVELFIWLVILFAISGSIIFAGYNYKKNINTYQIFLPDVDGLISGSPVRLMGIQIGYVSQIDIVGENVYLKFVVTEKNVKLPTGAVLNVEFSGLGGSKSIELYPPSSNKKAPGKFIIVQSPKRIHDSLGLLNDMFDQVADIAYTVSNFMDKVGIIRREQIKNDSIKTKDLHEFLNFSNDWLDNAQKQSDKISNKIKNGKAGKKNGTSYGEN